MSNDDQDETIPLSDVKQMLRRIRRDLGGYVPIELVSVFFHWCTERGWPAVSLADTLSEFEAEEISLIREWAGIALAELRPGSIGTRLGYITPEYERLMQSPLITREFIEALSEVGEDD